MATFAQMPPPGWSGGDLETEYLRLQREWRAERNYYDREAAQAAGDAQKLAALAAKYPNRENTVIMPPIPWDPYQSDFWYNEILNDIQAQLSMGNTDAAERIARRDGLNDLADLIENGGITALLADRTKSPTGNLVGLARSGAVPSLRKLAKVPPNSPDALRGHYLGTDSQGRDVASRLLYGFRISIFFALFLTIIGQVIGTFIGSLQGYLGGRFDILSQRLIEVLISIPFLYVVIILAALIVPSFWMLVGIMTVFQWIGITFYMRTEMYREKTKEYCLAAKSYGASHLRIIFRHLMPSFMSHLIASATLAIPGMILGETALSFLGLGIRPPIVSWGVLLNEAQNIQVVALYPWLMLPIVPVIIVVLAFNFMGDGLRDAADPYK